MSAGGTYEGLTSWYLPHLLQEIAAAVKLEYGASRAGYALEVYLALQRLLAAAAGEAVVEAEDVQTLLEELKVRLGLE